MRDSARQRSRERLEERERIILDAAARLFATTGFHATSTRRIAAAAGVSEGTVFHYFRSKNDLMLGILDRFYNEVLNPGAAGILDTVMGTRARLQALALAHVRALAADNALMLRLLQVYVGVDLEFAEREARSPLRALNRSYVGHLDRILREGMERGELRPDLELRPLRDLFFGTLEYGLRTHIYRFGEAGLEDYVALLLEPIWQSLRADAALAPDSGAALERIEAAARRLEQAVLKITQTGASKA
ncbi:MAG: TetR/AcrR family transcriptional regulator [Halieaceae bacterium]|jgi:AcrR family transcriptional regulator|nr:TetR/AcrR family transcriptional regulator [Halieaceae bacterium]